MSCMKTGHEIISVIIFSFLGWSGGVKVYLTVLGHPTDIGLQLGKACYPCSR